MKKLSLNLGSHIESLSKDQMKKINGGYTFCGQACDSTFYCGPAEHDNFCSYCTDTDLGVQCHWA